MSPFPTSCHISWLGSGVPYPSGTYRRDGDRQPRWVQAVLEGVAEHFSSEHPSLPQDSGAPTQGEPLCACFALQLLVSATCPGTSSARICHLYQPFQALPLGPGTGTGLAGFATPQAVGGPGAWAGQAWGLRQCCPVHAPSHAQPQPHLCHLSYFSHWRLHGDVENRNH